MKPAAHELEYHPWVHSEAHEIVSWCQGHDIAVIAYGSLGGSSNSRGGSLNATAAVADVARAHGVSPAALLLRWALDRRVAVIPGATSAEHIGANLHVPSVGGLSEAELEKIGASAARPRTFKSWANLPSEVAAGRAKGHEWLGHAGLHGLKHELHSGLHGFG